MTDSKTILLSPVPSSAAAWLPRLAVTRWRGALPFCAANKRDVACAWLVRDAVVPHSVYGLKYKKRNPCSRYFSVPISGMLSSPVDTRRGDLCVLGRICVSGTPVDCR